MTKVTPQDDLDTYPPTYIAPSAFTNIENVKIVKLTLEHLDIVHQFVVEEFAPDEPIFSRFGILQGTNFLSKMFNEEYKKELVIDPIESGHSFGAFDEKENLIGIKLGKIITKENMKRPDTWPPWILKFPDFLIPKTILCNVYFGKCIEWMDYYTEDRHFEHCDGNNGKIYEGVVICVAKNGRRQGLGDKLVKHALNHASEEGCSHAHTMTSSLFSQKIMKNNGFEVILEKNYEDFKDKHGKVLINHDIHKVAQINVLKL